MRPRYCLLLTVALSVLGSSVHAESWLITPLEMHKEAERIAEGLVFRERAETVPGAPQIKQVKPDAAAPVASPFDIAFHFIPQDGAVVDPQSFKVMYGFFRMDITSRVMQQAHITGEGVAISHANIPSGKHHLVLNVTDSKNRTGEAEFEIEVR